MHLTHKKFLSNFIIFLIIVITVGNLITFSEYQNLFRVNKDIMQSGMTMRSANQAIISLHEASMKVSEYLLANDYEAMKNLPETLTSAQLNLDALRPLIQDTREQRDAYNDLAVLVNEKFSYLQDIITAYKAGDKAKVARLASSKSRFELTNNINQKLFIIKKIELDQLSTSWTTLHNDTIIANSLFMLVNIITIVLLIFCLFRITQDDRKR